MCLVEYIRKERQKEARSPGMETSAAFEIFAVGILRRFSIDSF